MERRLLTHLQKVSTQVSLRGLHKLTWAETSCFLQIFGKLKDHDTISYFIGSFTLVVKTKCKMS